MQIVPIKQSPVGQILDLGKVHGVTVVVTNIELVIVHSCLMFQFSLKETAAGGETSLFGGIITPHLAVFQNIVSNKLVICNFICWLFAKQSFSLGVHNRILSLREDTLSVPDVKWI